MNVFSFLTNHIGRALAALAAIMTGWMVSRGFDPDVSSQVALGVVAGIMYIWRTFAPMVWTWVQKRIPEKARAFIADAIATMEGQGMTGADKREAVIELVLRSKREIGWDIPWVPNALEDLIIRDLTGRIIDRVAQVASARKF